MTALLEDSVVSTPDGHAIHVTTMLPAGATAWLVINSAMGVRRRFYRHLAEWLAARGIGVVTYDYRGMGDSLLNAEQLAGVRLEHWGSRDFPAVLDWLRTSYSPARVTVLGHSVGGQVLGLTPAVRDLDGVIGVGTQAGYWGHWRGFQRLQVYALWHAAIPLLTPLLGRFPASAVGLGQDLPPGVAYQWAAWGRDPEYLRSARVGPQPQFYGEVRCRLRTYLIGDDEFAPPAAVRAWHDWFPVASREFIDLGTHTLGGRPIGHFGFFDREVGPEVWPGLDDFVRG